MVRCGFTVMCADVLVVTCFCVAVNVVVVDVLNGVCCCGVGGVGMNYLHDEAPITVLHRDLKSKNGEPHLHSSLYRLPWKQHCAGSHHVHPTSDDT